MATKTDSTHANAQDNNGGAEPTPLAERRLAPGTRHAYGRALLRLDDWLEGRPVTDESLADYLAALFDRGLAPASAATAVAAAKDRARREGAASPAGTRTAAALSAYRRDGAGRGPGQVAGVQWEDSDRMADKAERCGDARGLRDALLVRIMSDGLLRVSEAEALDVADIALSKGKLLVTIRRSKTDQDGRGVVFRGGPDTARLARKWLEAAGIEEGPVFRPVNKAGRVADARLGRRSVRDIVKRRAADAGIEGRVSGHSLRVGSAQSLRNRGATTADLMDAGRWSRVETMAGYVRAQDAALGPMARLRYGVGRPNGRGSRPRPRKAKTARRERRWARQASKRLRRASKKVEKGLARIERAVIGS